MGGMSKESDKKHMIDKGMLLFVTLFIVSVLVAGLILSTLTFSMYEKADIVYLQGELDKKTNITDDYRNGWLDCMEELVNLRCAVTNMTSQLEAVVGDR